jgi:hypothetical protein
MKMTEVLTNMFLMLARALENFLTTLPFVNIYSKGQPSQLWAIKRSPIIAVNPDECKTISAFEFGDLSNHFLHVINISPNADGNFKLELE